MKYAVQFLTCREIVVDSDDDIQATKEAFAQLTPRERSYAVAVKVLEKPTDEGAMCPSTADAWDFSRRTFEAIDSDSIQS